MSVTALERQENTIFRDEVFEIVHARAVMGVTDSELQKMTGKGHGATSSALSILHKRGLLVRLKEKRQRFSVYVTPEYVEGREVVARKQREVSQQSGLSALEALAKHLDMTIDRMSDRALTAPAGERWEIKVKVGAYKQVRQLVQMQMGVLRDLGGVQ